MRNLTVPVNDLKFEINKCKMHFGQAVRKFLLSIYRHIDNSSFPGFSKMKGILLTQIFMALEYFSSSVTSERIPSLLYAAATEAPPSAHFHSPPEDKLTLTLTKLHVTFNVSFIQRVGPGL